MSRRRVLAAAPVLAVLLAGCASDGRAELRNGVEAVTDAANARDADGVRDAVDDLLTELNRQVASGELTSPESARIAAAARQVQDSAVLVDGKAIEAERKARAEAERKARAEAERKARAEAERKARAEAERKAREENQRKAEEQVREAEENQREAEEQAREAEEQAREAEEQARKAQEDAGKDEQKKQRDDDDEKGEQDGDGDGG